MKHYFFLKIWQLYWSSCCVTFPNKKHIWSSTRMNCMYHNSQTGMCVSCDLYRLQKKRLHTGKSIEKNKFGNSLLLAYSSNCTLNNFTCTICKVHVNHCEFLSPQKDKGLRSTLVVLQLMFALNNSNVCKFQFSQFS